MSRVTILGAGSWGTALASILQHHHPVTLWSRDIDLARAIAGDRQNRRYLPGIDLGPAVAVHTDLAAALKGAEAVVLAIPSAGMEEACRLAAPLVPRDALLVSASKGLTEVGGLRMSQVIGRSPRRRMGHGRLIASRCRDLRAEPGDGSRHGAPVRHGGSLPDIRVGGALPRALHGPDVPRLLVG